MIKHYQNAFYCTKSKTYFISANTHAFVGRKYEDGREYYVDGGCSYFKTVGDFTLEDDGTVISFRLDSSNTFEEICSKMLYFDRNKIGKICDLSPKMLVRLYNKKMKNKFVDKMVLKVFEHFIIKNPTKPICYKNFYFGFRQSILNRSDVDVIRGILYYKSFPFANVWMNPESKWKNSLQWEINRDDIALEYKFPDNCQNFETIHDMMVYCENWAQENIDF